MKNLHILLMSIFVVCLIAMPAQALDGFVQDLNIKKAIGKNKTTGQKVVDKSGFWDLSALNFSTGDTIRVIIKGTLPAFTLPELEGCIDSGDLDVQKVICKNRTTGQKVKDLSGDDNCWDCLALDGSEGDKIKITIKGLAK